MIIQLLMALSLSGLSTPAPITLGQFEPCVWPRRCATQTLTAAQILPCPPPRVCTQRRTAAL